jgi:predicted branched-subunit amino acid permease
LTPDPTPRFNAAGLREGARMSVGLLPGTAAMGVAFGTLAAQKGFTLAEAVTMTALMYSGAAQLVALEIWSPPFSLSALLTLMLVVGTVNLRYVLMSASVQPMMAGMPWWQTYPALMFTVDANWLVAMRYRTEGGRDPSIFLASGVVIWIVWTLAAVPGFLLGSMVTEPKRLALDLAIPAFFAAMLVPLWRGRRRAIPWVIAGAVAYAVSLMVPGWWFIIAGAIAGSVAGGFLDERR